MTGNAYYIYIKDNCIVPFSSNLDYIGSYKKREGTATLNALPTIKRHFLSENGFYEPSSLMISSLNSIINLCLVNKAIPILVETPVMDSYESKIPQQYKDLFLQQVEKYKQRNVMFIKADQMLFNKSMFYDPHHLNNEGAQLFSQIVGEQIE